MKTTVTKAKDIKRQWHLIDVSGLTLGRISTKIAGLLMGKHKPMYTPHLDCGDYVIVTNAQKIEVTGNKRADKLYQHHTGHPGGFREINFEKLQEKDPARIIITSVKGMLPKNKLRDLRLKRLKVYTSDTHPYEHQLKKEK